MAYRYSFPDVVLVEADIRSIDKSTILDCDIVTAGFPCQQFSVRGKQRILPACLLSAAAAEGIMAGGYYIIDAEAFQT